VLITDNYGVDDGTRSLLPNDVASVARRGFAFDHDSGYRNIGVAKLVDTDSSSNASTTHFYVSTGTVFNGSTFRVFTFW
jgi:hypothetical protein